MYQKRTANEVSGRLCGLWFGLFVVFPPNSKTWMNDVIPLFSVSNLKLQCECETNSFEKVL